jgi:hypothetical protein
MNKKAKVLDVVGAYLRFAKNNGKLPSNSDLAKLGVSRETVRHRYGSITDLHKFVKQNHSQELSEYVFDESLFTEARFKDLVKETKKYKKFVITTSVVEKSVDQNFLKSLRSYCRRNKAMLLVLPCADVASRGRGSEWILDPVLKNEHIVYNDLSLNDNLFICSIKLSAKHINPLTGLSRIGQRNGSFVYASPKQALEFVATKTKGIPHALMTPGAVTVGDYNTDKYMSGRTSYIAENDHVLGAVVVEISDRKLFHFRQIQADKTGSFIDLGVQYDASGKTKRVIPEAFVLGDYHSGETDLQAKQAWKEVCKLVKPKNLVLHDLYDGKSISHHDLNKPGKRAAKAMLNQLSLESEIRGMCSDLNEMMKWVNGELVIVKSNHDEVLERYLNEGRYIQDPHNHYLSLKLAQKQLEQIDPLKYAAEELFGVANKSRIKWLLRDEEYRIANVECGAHGDKGANGSKGSLLSLEKAYGSCIIGHAHTAAILRGVFRVGTSSKLDLDYASGPSSWTHTSCLIYPNGSRQLINVIYGKWHL